MTTTTTPAPIAHTTRRNLLIAAPAVGAIAAIPTIAFAAAVPADRRAWNTALAAYDRVRTEDVAFSTRYHAVWERCSAACARVPHVALPPEPHTGRNFTTADDWAVRSARHAVKQMDAGKMRLDPKVPGVQEHFDWQRSVVGAVDERDAALQVVRKRFAMDEADDESEKLGDRLADAASVLMTTPAPDLAALRWKLDYMHSADGSESIPAWSMDFVAQALADIARLLPEAS